MTIFGPRSSTQPGGQLNKVQRSDSASCLLIVLRDVACGGDQTAFTSVRDLVIKACVPRRFWLTSFILANVLTDIWVLYYLHCNEPPIHHCLHTYAGGFAAATFAGLFMFAVIHVVSQLRPRHWIKVVKSITNDRFRSNHSLPVTSNSFHMFCSTASCTTT